jgi:hypothetical protein
LSPASVATTALAALGIDERLDTPEPVPPLIVALALEELGHERADVVASCAEPLGVHELLEVLLHRARARITRVGVALQRAVDDARELVRHVDLGVERQDLARERVVQRRDLAVALEEALAREGLPHHDAEAPDVRALIVLSVGRRLLRRDVGELALHLPRPRLDELRACARDAEVEQLHLAVVRDVDVAGRDVAVDDVERRAVEVLERVRVLQPVEELDEHPRAHPERERLIEPTQVPQDACERLPLQVLHREEVEPLDVADLVGLHDVRVVQPRREPRLVEEHPDERVFLLQMGVQTLEDAELREAGRATHRGEEHLGHAAVPNLRDQCVFAEARVPEHGRRGADFARGEARGPTPSHVEPIFLSTADDCQRLPGEATTPSRHRKPRGHEAHFLRSHEGSKR